MPQTDPKSSHRGEQQQTDQIAENPYSQQFENDTIDLYEMWFTLWKWKWLVISVTVAAALGSVVYALNSPSIYKAEARLLPAKSKNIQPLHILNISNISESKQSSGQAGNSAISVFSKYIQNLRSRTLHKKFIQENGLMDLLAPERTPETRDEEIYQGFAKLIILEEKDGITSLSIELHDGEIAAKWVNDLTEFANKETVASLLEELKISIENKVKDIEYSIASKRDMAKRRRQDKIARYDEAAKIAYNLGIKRRVDATNVIQTTQMNVDIATSATPLYYLGYEALMTEISILKNRNSDDPFIKGLRDLQEELTLLRSVTFDKEKIRSVHIDQLAYPPKGPIKPNRRLIVSLVTIVGLFSGIFLSLFIELVQKQRKKHLK